MGPGLTARSCDRSCSPASLHAQVTSMHRMNVHAGALRGRGAQERTAARAAAVDPVRVLDLVRPARQTAHVHYAPDRPTARFDLHKVRESIHISTYSYAITTWAPDRCSPDSGRPVLPPAPHSPPEVPSEPTFFVSTQLQYLYSEITNFLCIQRRTGTFYIHREYLLNRKLFAVVNSC